MAIVERSASENPRPPASRVAPPLPNLIDERSARPKQGTTTSRDRSVEFELTAVLFPYRRRCARCEHGTTAFVLTRDGLPICTFCYLEVDGLA